MPITYCIECNITGEKYYGSTKSTLSIRMNKHRHNLNCASKEILLRDDYVVYTLHEYDTIEEAKLKEDWYIRNNECINERRVCVTYEEKKHYQKQYDKVYKKIYHQENKERLNEKSKEYRQENKEQIREHSKEYYQKNKERISEQKKEYRQKNKERISEKESKKVECEFCKFIGRKGDLRRHQRSKKCKQFQ